MLRKTHAAGGGGGAAASVAAGGGGAAASVPGHNYQSMFNDHMIQKYCIVTQAHGIGIHTHHLLEELEALVEYLSEAQEQSQ